MQVNRSGFALLELLVALVMLTIVGGAIYQGLARQQRLFRSIALVLATRGDVRDASEVLVSDLSTASISDTLGIAADSAVEFFGVVGTSALDVDATGTSIRLVREDADDSGPAVTSFISIPDTGDLAMVFRDNGGVGTWAKRRILSVSSSGGVLVVALDSPADSAKSGAAVRFLRRARYSLYRSSDSKWYLGYRRCNATGSPACGTVQPVSGPYSRHGGDLSGVRIAYFDAAGTALDASEARYLSARVELRLLAIPDGAVELGRITAGQQADSAATSVAFRVRP